jgi:hypothetical protein
VALHTITASTTTSDGAYWTRGQAVWLSPTQEAALAGFLRATTFRDTTGESIGVSN